MDAVAYVKQPTEEFVRDSWRLMKRCTKPDRTGAQRAGRCCAQAERGAASCALLRTAAGRAAPAAPAPAGGGVRPSPCRRGGTRAGPRAAPPAAARPPPPLPPPDRRLPPLPPPPDRRPRRSPARAEFSKIAQATSIGFAIMGFIGFFVKLIFIPINNIIVGMS